MAISDEISLAEHLKCCLLVEGDVDGGSKALQRMLSIHHPAKILSEVALNEAIAWLLPLTFRATRYLLRPVGDRVAIVSNSTGDTASGEVPLSTIIGGRVVALMWREEQRFIRIATAGHTTSAIQVYRDRGWLFAAMGQPIRGAEEWAAAKRKQDRLTPNNVLEFLRREVPAASPDLWSTPGAVLRVEQTLPADTPGLEPRAHIDDRGVQERSARSVTMDYPAFMGPEAFLRAADDGSFPALEPQRLQQVVGALVELFGDENVKVELTSSEGVEGAPLAERIWVHGASAEQIERALGDDGPNEVEAIGPATADRPDGRDGWLCLFWD